MRQRSLPLLPICLVLFFLASAGWPATVEVTVRNFAFIPSEVDIQVGDTVVWTLQEGIHSVLANNGSFSSGAPGTNFPFSHTFNSAGVFGYHCGVHPYMLGRVNVDDDTGNGDPGTLKLSGTAFNIAEGNAVTLQAQRLNGDDGPVSVSFTVTAGTAQPADFTATSGTLAWPDGDDDPKTISVVTIEDTAVESNETIQVTLSSPTGGASIDGAGKTAFVTIQDDDSSTSPPAAPQNLQVDPHSTTEMMLSWTDVSGETSYRIEQQDLGGTFQEVATTAGNVTGTVVGGLEPGAFYTFRLRAANAAGVSPYSNEASDSTLAPIVPCVPSSTTLCLNGGRFQVDTSWRSSLDNPLVPATAVPLSAPSSGLFYFFSPDNIEMLIKVLNACVPALGNKYWVFYAATTNVELQITVTDTNTGRRRYYFNPLNRPAPPVQDTEAFSTCP